LYVNGNLIASSTRFISGVTTNNLNVRIGAAYCNDANCTGAYNDRFNGLADEVEYFNRALNQTEVQAIYNAGSAGKCRTCTPPPANMISWWPGDGNANDIQDSNNGTLQNGATFATGMVGQAFSFNSTLNSGVVIPSSPALNATEAITIDAWVKPSSFPNGAPTVVRKDQQDLTVPEYLLAIGDGATAGVAHCNIGGFGTPVGGSVPLNQWSHLACTYDREIRPLVRQRRPS